jgi:hypothetical protein
MTRFLLVVWYLVERTDMLSPVYVERSNRNDMVFSVHRWLSSVAKRLQKKKVISFVYKCVFQSFSIDFFETFLL